MALNAFVLSSSFREYVLGGGIGNLILCIIPPVLICVALVEDICSGTNGFTRANGFTQKRFDLD